MRLRMPNWLRKALPWIMSGVASAGVIGTGILSAKGHNQAIAVLEEEGALKESFLEKVKLTWKCYAPAIGAGAGTIGLIFANTALSQKQITALAASAGVAIAGRDKFKKAVEKKYGRDETVEIEKEAYSDKILSIEKTGNGDMLFYEEFSGRWFLSSLEAVMEAEEMLNDKYERGIGVSLNDFYDLLRIRRSGLGFQFGWPTNFDYYDAPIMFANSMISGDEENEDFYIVEILTYPMDQWYDL